MGKILEFNNGLLTNVESSDSNPSYKKRCKFKNGLLISVEETTISSSTSRYLSFKNGLLTSIGGEIVIQGIHLGESVTKHISATYIDTIITDVYRYNYTVPFTTNIVGFILAFKDISYYITDTGSSSAHSSIRMESGAPTLSNNTLVDYNQSYIFRPSIDDTWWETTEIKDQVYALVDDITPLDENHYTHYSTWCQDLLDGNNHVVKLQIFVDKYHYEVTYFWTPVYYIP